MQEPIKFCPACGQQNNLSAAFCQKCGLRYAEESPPIAQPKKPRGLPFYIACGLGLIVFVSLISWIFAPPPGSTVSTSQTPVQTPAPSALSADTGLADRLADNLAIVFAEAASRDTVGIAANNGTEIHVRIKDMKDFEFRRLEEASLKGIRLWMSKHANELNQTKVRKVCVTNGHIMGLSACVSR